MAMFKPLPYEGLQTIFRAKKELTERERLSAAAGPLLFWYGKHKRDLPWRRDKDAYRIWISEIMLQQTRVEAVKPYYFRFMESFPTIQALSEAPEEKLLKCWEGLGYYSRARNLKKAAEIVVREHAGALPDSREKLLALPGIGSYTAGAIASIAYDLPVPAVDGNVLRVLSRVFGSREDILKQSTRKRMEALVEDVLEEHREKSAGDFNQALIEIGAVVCVPNGAPHCEECPFSTVCLAREKGLTGEIPVKSPKKKRKIEEKTVLLLEYKDKIAIRKRKEDGLLASLYEFVNIPGKISEEKLEMLPGAEGAKILPLPESKHIFSHVEWHMYGYLICLPEIRESECGISYGGTRAKEETDGILFVEWDEIKDKYPVPNAFAAYKKFLDERYGG